MGPVPLVGGELKERFPCLGKPLTGGRSAGTDGRFRGPEERPTISLW